MKQALNVEQTLTPVETSASSTSTGLFTKIKRTVEWTVWWVGRLIYNWNIPPGYPEFYPPPPSWKPEDWYGEIPPA